MKPALQPAPTNARQRSQADTRRRILGAAANLMKDHGSKNTTIAMTARLAGVAAGTVYLHFQDKDTLIGEVLKLALGELRRSLDPGGQAPAATVAADVRQKMDGLAGFVAEQPDLAAMLFDPAVLHSPAGADALEFLLQSQLRGVTAGQERGWYRRDLPAARAARGLVGQLFAVLGAWARRPGSATRDDVVATLCQMRLGGLAGRK